jgi:hypothetical protein
MFFPPQFIVPGVQLEDLFGGYYKALLTPDSIPVAKALKKGPPKLAIASTVMAFLASF